MSVGDFAASELRVLVAVAQEKSFSAAAAKLGLTQSAVSYAVRSAERKAGAVLFRRGRRGAAPTQAGTIAVWHARRILRLLDVMCAETHLASAGEMSGTVRVAAFRSAAFHLLPGVLSRFGQRHPKVTVDVSVVREDIPGALSRVLAGQADVAIATLSGPLEGLVAKELFTDPYVLAYPAGHPTPRALPKIYWREAPSQETKRWCAAQAWASTGCIRVADDSVAMSMVGHGLGAAIVPRLTLVGAPPTVAMQSLGPDAPVRRVGYVTTVEMANSLVLRELISELRKQSSKNFTVPTELRGEAVAAAADQ
ncbi:LysR family transcriptional regulator [Streptomyces spiralis]